MLMVKLNKWSTIDNTQHISTTWVVYADQAKQQIVDGPYTKSETMVDMLISNINIPVGVTYYVSATRHFNKSDVDYEIPLIEVTSKSETYNNMLLPQDTIIELPYTYIENYNGNEATAIKTLSKITLKTSKFRANNDIHKATHYFIYDQNDNILFSKLEAINNQKYSIEVDVTNDMKLASKLKFVTIHKGSTDLESKAGVLTIDMNIKEPTFSITTNLTNIEPLQDLEVIFKQVNNNIPIDIIKVNLVKTNNKEVILELPYYNNKVIIPFQYLQDGNDISIEVVTPDASGYGYEYIYKPITIFTTDGYTDIVQNYPYENKFKTIEANEPQLPNKVISKALYNGYILFPSNNKDEMMLKSYTLGENGLVFRKDTNITIPSSKEYINILPLSKIRVLIDMLNEDNFPTFYIYTYSILNDTFVLEKSITREDETISLGKTNNIVQISSTNVIYIPVGINKIKTFNTITGNISTVTRITTENIEKDDIPLENLTKPVILRTNANRIIIGNTTTTDAICYNYANNEYSDGYTYGLDTHLNKESIPVILKSGDTIIYDVENDNNFTNAFIKFNIDKMSFSNLDFELELIKPTSIIYTNDHKVIFTNFRTSLELGNKQRYFIYY